MPARRAVAFAIVLPLLCACEGKGSDGAAPASSASAQLTGLVATGVVRPAVDRGDLDASIGYGIQLLEEQRYREFVLDFAAPVDRAALQQHGGIDGILPEFSKHKAPKLLEYFRAAKRGQPTRDGDLATFTLDGAVTLIFVRDHGRWYLRNGK
jgi:hypothetical protein